MASQQDPYLSLGSKQLLFSAHVYEYTIKELEQMDLMQDGVSITICWDFRKDPFASFRKKSMEIAKGQETNQNAAIPRTNNTVAPREEIHYFRSHQNKLTILEILEKPHQVR